MDKFYILFFLFRLNKFRICLALFYFSVTTHFSQAQINPGFENNNGTAFGWTIDPLIQGSFTTSIGTDPAVVIRSGRRRLDATVTTSSARDIAQHINNTISIPATGTNYVHVIGYFRSTEAADLGYVSAISTDGGTNRTGTSTAGVAGSWVRLTASGTATNGKTYIPRFSADGNGTAGGDTYAFDDIIIYTTTLSAGADITAPNTASTICINVSGNNNIITWTDGTDNATNTSGINGVLLLRAPAGTALPTLLSQAYYSTDETIGQKSINGWTVLSNSINAGVQTYTDNNAAGTPYVYAVYMRDKAYNYSTSLSFTTANGGSDQAICSTTSATMAATAAPSGYTGTWSLVSGTGTITSVNSSTTTITGITSNSVFKWTVSNGSGCSTFDLVNIFTSVGTDGYPLNDTVYNQIGPASFGISPTFTTSVTYQWQESTNSGSSWSNITNGGVYSGATDSILKINNPTFSMDGYLYRCVLTRASCGTFTSTSARLAVITLTTFSNSTAQACGTDFTNTFGTFTRTIAVSSLPTTLGSGLGQYVLREIDVKLGSSSCKKDLSSYDFRLTAPDGTNLDFITDLTTTASNIWTDLHFRDQSALEKIREYSNTAQSSYFPFSIGYYAVDVDNSFQSTFNGKNPNGNWIFSIKESATTGTEISFESVKLTFGPAYINNAITSVDANNECSGATCLDTKSKIIATNNFYGNNDPNYPSSPVSGCNWNSANNNSVWFYFIASATTAYITISGNVNPTPGTDDTQPLVVSRTGDCSGTFTVPTGGCPDDETRNNMSYLSSNGGGITTSGNVYVNGIGPNTEFNLSGLTVGQKYYLYVDGNGGVASTFYVEAINGCAVCVTLLPVELIDFYIECNNNVNELKWTTASEFNSSYFEIQSHKDDNNIEWKTIGKVKAAGESYSIVNYNFINKNDNQIANYYRLKIVDLDGGFKYSNIIFSDCIKDISTSLIFLKDLNQNYLTIKSKTFFKYIPYFIYNTYGSLINQGTLYSDENLIDISDFERQLYIIRIEDKVFKFIKN